MTKPPAALAKGLGLLVLGAGLALAAQRWVLPLVASHPDESEPKSADGETETTAVALVRTINAARAPMHTQVHGFGVVAVKPGATSTLSWPTELLVRKVLAVPGHAVASGAPLLEVQPSPDAALQLTLAGQAEQSTRAAVENARARLELNLATRQDLQAAEAAAGEAQARLHRLTAAPLPADGLIRAGFAGVVQSVRSQSGAVVPAGTPLVELAPSAGLVAQIGLEPALAAQVTVGTRMHARPVAPEQGTAYEGTVSRVSPTINTATHLVDVILEFSDQEVLPVGLWLEATADTTPVDALCVPRQSVLPTENGEAVFVLHDGKAVRRDVKIGLRERERVQVLEGVAAGEAVVILGQAELEDGMAVRTADAKPPEGHP